MLLCHVTRVWHRFTASSAGLMIALQDHTSPFRRILKSLNARVNTDLSNLLPTMSPSNTLEYLHAKAVTESRTLTFFSWAKGSGDQLKRALDNFEAVLTPKQKNRLQGIAAVPDAPAIIAFTTQLDNENAKRGSRCVATRLLTFLQSIQQFTAVVDTFVSSNPAIAALVWGSV